MEMSLSPFLVLLGALSISGSPAEDPQMQDTLPVEETLNIATGIDAANGLYEAGDDYPDIEEDAVDFADLQEKIANLEEQVAYLSSRPPSWSGIYEGEDEEGGNIQGLNPGGVYVRWGRDDCPTSTSDKVYNGIAGSSHHRASGGGGNILCLPNTPNYSGARGGVQGLRGYVYSIDYETSDFDALSHVHNHDVPCAVCQAKGRSNVLMVPARYECPPEWTLEYDGFLMSERDSYTRSDYVCVDSRAEARPGSSGSSNNSELFPVEGRCSDNGGLPCGPYVNGYELTCAVCTR